MKIKKVITGLTALVTIASAVSFVSVKKPQAASLNSIAEKNSYVGTTYLYKMLAVSGIRYNKFYTKNKIVYRNHGKPEGIVIHETADPGATARNEAIYFNREWNKMYSYVHAFADHQQVIQMMTPDYGVWGAGPMANNRFVQIELCEENTRDNFAKSINNDAIWSAKILHRYHLTPSNATHNGKGTVWSHAAVSKFLGGTNHGDPVDYFNKWGYSMDDFYNLIKHYYDLQGANTKKSHKAKKVKIRKKSSKNAIKVPKAKKGQKILMHDALVYNNKGKKIKGSTRKAGIAVNILGTKTIKKRKFYQISKTEYIAAGNLDGKWRTLKANAYIYDTAGVSDGKTELVKGSQIKTYGSRIKIEGVSYYPVSPTQFVKVENF